MIPLMQECTQEFVNTFRLKKGPNVLEAKDTYRKLLNDVIASVAFGVKVNTLVDDQNLFYTLGKRTADFTGVRGLIFFGYSNFPKIMKVTKFEDFYFFYRFILQFFRIQMYDDNISSFFTNLIKSNLAERKLNNIVRPDFLHLLTQDKDRKVEFSLTEIVAHSLIFFFAGFETVAFVLAFISYELALNPDIQEKLYDEIVNVLEKHNGEATYEAISEMDYLDNVISESLRLHPPTYLTDRKCVKPYTIEPKNDGERTLPIDKGSYIWVPIQEIQLDPKNFPDPLKFDPDRFNAENKVNIKPYTYLPFGIGPRFCIGTRFALMTVKIILIDIVRNFELFRTEKTEIPVTYKLDSIQKQNEPVFIPRNFLFADFRKMLLLLVGCAVLLLFLFIYYRTKSIYKYWEKHGVKHIKPVYFFGNLADVVFRKKSLYDTIKGFYYLDENARYVGCYQFFKPCLVVRDPELLKQITIKDFDHFPDHNVTMSEKIDPLWGNSLPSKTAENGWYEARSKISPYFTAQKLRIMIPLMQECTQELIKSLRSKKSSTVLEAKGQFSKLLNDVIASVAFGVKVNTIVDETNLFYTLGKKASNLSGLKALIFFGYSNFSSVMEFFRIQMYDKNISSFFINLIKTNLEERNQNNIVRPDFLHLLTKNTDKVEFSLIEIVAHSLIFFFAGFESVSFVLSLTCYELALNPDIQKRVYDEIVSVLKEHNGEVTYEAITKITYLDNVISESLRKCVKPYVIKPKKPGERPLHLFKGSYIWVPIKEIQLDPKHFADPLKFDPERFNSENKAKIKPYTYLPFGVGPRFCIGARFSLIVVKVVLIDIVKNFELHRTEKTEVPITYKYWKKQGVNHIKPVYFFGNLADVVFRKKSLLETIKNFYYLDEDARYVGCYQFFQPCLVVRDPELLKQITIRDFKHFPDHTVTTSEKVDPLWGNSLPSKTAENGWYNTRSKISPYFTGQKFRIMVPLIQDCAQELIKSLRLKKSSTSLEAKDEFNKLLNDVIASVAFGVKVNTIVDDTNLFYALGKKTADFSGFKALIFLGYANFPRVMEFFRFKVFDKNISEFYTKLIKNNLEERKVKNIIRPDFLHLLTNDADNKVEFTLTEIVAHSLLFYFGGFESVAFVLSHTCYELALNPDVQKKTYDEIVSVLKEHNGEASYEAITKMTYLDNVVSESLRLYPPTYITDRKCAKPYIIKPKKPGERPLHIHKGLFIWVPIKEIQLDPKNFPDPLKFDPERFNSENKTKIKPFTYLPFGIGPRFCIGTFFCFKIV
ncbi:hypothetical protein RN001_003977 [Aquatica leii]|uniref:Cytochrome P450 n=1 Tax=Aquatica leii TaxID=1421715 RepID=A0AAN7PRQ3_9COLE|nr:hypothetical protein RN001_003977 [Aquatica leii]